MDRYAARICWNSKGWIVPSGDANKLEHGNEAGTTYVQQHRFGHEEWLFNFEWVLDGWKYGYLQPVTNSWAKVSGQKIELYLYSIGPRSSWFYVGHINPCEVLTDDLVDEAVVEFKKRGWLRQMKEQARAVGGNARQLDAGMIFNIRFKPSDAEILDPMKPIGSRDAIRRLRRYRLVMLEGKNAKVRDQWPHRTGTRDPGATGTVPKRSIPATTMDLAHATLQHELYVLLVKQYGKAAVIKEEDFADIKLKRDGQVTIIEVKTDPRPMRAVREALGQLLEYAFGCANNGDTVGRLVVAAPGEPSDLDRRYIEHLRSERGLPLHYVCFRQGRNDVNLGG
jgi:hypothetical protein